MSQKVKKSVVFAALLACTGLTPAYANMFRTAGDASQDELSIPPMVPQSTAEGADNLGNHRAEEPLVMGGFGITGVGLPQPDPVAPGGYDPSAAVNVQFLSAVINGIEVPEYEPDNLGNHTATQILNMSGHAIINVADSYGGAGHQAVNIRTLNQYLAALPGPDNLGNHIATRTLNLNGNAIQLGSITSYDGSGNPVYGPGIHISGTTITNLGTPINATDAVNKTYVDGLVGGIDLSGYVTIAGAQTITGAKTFSAQIVASNGINVSNRKIVNVATPTANADAANKAYVDAQIAGIPAGAIYTAGSGLILSGNTFAVDGTVVRTTGTQTIAGTKVFSGTIRVPTPATGPDAANKAYVDAQIAAIPAGAIYTAGSGLILSGNTFAVDGTVVRTTGTQTIAGAKTFSSAVTVATPTASGHATTKAYVDGLFSGVPSTPVYTAGTGLTLTGNTFAVNNTVVRTSGNQTIAGNKTFSSTINIAADTNQGIRFRAADNSVQSMIYGNATSMRLLAYATDGTTVASQLILLNDGRILPGTGRFDGGNQRITTVADPSAAQDAVNLRTLQTAVAAGGDNLGNHTATLNLNLNNNRIINVAAPINNTDAATKVYVDNLFAALPPGATYAAGSGLTLTGNIFSADSSVVRTSGTQSIAGAKTFTTALTVQTPTAAGHATTKAYVDAMVGGVTDTNTTYTAGAGLTLTGTVFSVNNTVVRTSGNQSIGGVKTFTSPIRVTNTFNVDGAGPGEQQNGLYLADLGTTAGTTLSPNMTAAIMGQISSTRSVGFTVDPSGYVYGFRSHSGVGPYTWQSKVRQADVATTLATPYTAGSGITVSGTNVIAVNNTVVRTTGNQSIAGVKTFTGDIIVPTPTAPTEAANKAYVDSLVSALPPGATYGAGDGLSLSGTTFAVNNSVVRTSGNQSIAGVKTFSGSIFVDGTSNTPDLILRRTNSAANAVMSFTTTGAGDVFIGQGDNATFNIGSGNDIRHAQTGVFSVTTTNGNVRWKGVATGVLNAANARLQAVATPTAGTDAANKAYVDAQIAAVPDANTTYTAGSGLSLSGTTFAVNNTVVRTTGNQSIAGVKTFTGGIIVPTPTAPTEAVNKAYVDSRPDANTTYAAGSGLSLSGTTFAVNNTVVRTTGNQSIAGVKTFSGSINIDGTSSTPDFFLRRTNSANNANMAFSTTGAGDVYIGQGDNATFNIGSGNDIRHAQTGVFSVHTTNGNVAWKGTATGVLNAANARLQAVATPTAGTDAANKAYVDARIAAAPDSNTTYTAGSGLSLSGTTFAVNNTVVRTTGNQSIAGTKNFTSGSLQVTAAGTANAHLWLRGNSTNRALIYAGSTGTVVLRNYALDGTTIAGELAISTTGSIFPANGGFFNANGTRIQGLATPTAGTDAANKAYVDSRPDSNTTYTAGSGLSLSGTTFAVNNTVVRTTGNQTVAGTKTFSSPIMVTNTFNVNGSGPGEQRNGLYVADLGGTAGTTLSPNNTLAIMAQTSSARSVGVTVAGGGYLYGFRSHSNAGTYTWESKVRQANVATTLATPYTAGAGITVSGANVIAVNNTVVRTTGNQSIAGVKTFTGDIIVPTPTAPTEAANKAYVDSRPDANTTYAAGSGLSLSGTTFAVNNTVVRTTGNQSIAGVKTFSGSINIDGTSNTPDLILRRTNSAANAVMSFTTTETGNVFIGQGDNATFNIGSGNDIRHAQTGVFSVHTTNGNVRWKGTATGVLNAANARLQAVATPTAETDAANKAYVDSRPDANTTYAAGAGLSLSGTTFAVNNTVVRTTGNQSIAGAKTFTTALTVQTPTAAGHATTKAYVDSRPDANTTYAAGSGLSLSGTTFAVNNTVVRTTGDQTIAGIKYFSNEIHSSAGNNYRIRGTTNSAFFRYDGNNFHLLFSDTTTGSYNALRPFSVSAATGNVTIATGLSLAGKKITSLGTPTAGTDAANKAYVDSRPDANTTYAAGSGLSLSGTTFAVNNTVVRTTGNQTIAGVKTFSGSINIDGTGTSPDLVIRRTNSGTNANMRFFTTGTGDVTLGQGDNGWFNVGSGNDIRWGNTSTFAVQVSNGNIRWKGTATGNGSGITNLNANNLATGTVAVERLPIRNANNTGIGVLGYNGHTSSAGQFYGGSTNPSGNRRVNYDGNFYATRMWSTVYYYFSDERLKKDIELISPAEGTEIIKDLRPVSYTWKQDGKEALGVIAQDVQKVIPTAVIENEGGDLAVDYVQMIAPMVAAMQDMEARIAELEAELKAARAE